MIRVIVTLRSGRKIVERFDDDCTDKSIAETIAVLHRSSTSYVILVGGYFQDS